MSHALHSPDIPSRRPRRIRSVSPPRAGDHEDEGTLAKDGQFANTNYRRFRSGGRAESTVYSGQMFTASTPQIGLRFGASVCLSARRRRELARKPGERALLPGEVLCRKTSGHDVSSAPGASPLQGGALISPDY